MTRDEFLSELRIVDDVFSDEPLTIHAQNLADYDADRRVMIKEQQAEIAALKMQLATAKQGQDLLRELRAVVKGECPALLNEDSGGNSELDMEIENLLKKERP